MRQFTVFVLFIVSVVGAGYAAAQEADPQGTAESGAAADQDAAQQARAAFEEAVSLFEQGEYARSADLFRKAYTLRPGWKILFNLGQAEAAAKRHGLALDAFERYLAEGGDEVPSQNRDEALAEIERLRPIVGLLAISGPAGAHVWVDGVDRGALPLPGPIRVAASVPHQVEFRDASGAVTAARTVSVPGGTTVAVGPNQIGVGSGASAASAPPPKKVRPRLSPEERRRRSYRRRAKVFTIIGSVALGLGALGVAGVVSSAVEVSNTKHSRDACTTDVCRDDKQADLILVRSQLVGAVILTTGLLTAGTVFLVVGLKNRRALQAMDAQPVALLPAVGPRGGGLTLRWSW